MPKLTNEQRLTGLKEAYRTLPTAHDIYQRGEETKLWIGRTKVLLEGTGKSINRDIKDIEQYYDNDSAFFSDKVEPARNDIQQSLIDAIAKLDIELGSQAVAIEPGNVFDYFNETRKLLTLAKSDIFLIDPYVDSSVVSDYFATIDSQIKVRILTSAKPGVLNSIKPAAEKLNQQTSLSIEIRSVNSNDHLHDRFWIIDGTHGYQSSSSIKDGGKKAAAVILQVHDIFDATKMTYEGYWANGNEQFRA